MKFTIESVAQMTGVPAASLRNWEKRYGFPKPERSEGGHRFYSDKDVQFLKLAQKWSEEGLALTEIAKKYDSFMSGPELFESPAESILEIMDDVTYRSELIYKSLLKFDQLGTLQHYQILVTKLAPDLLFERVFEKILRKLGEDWVHGKISIAQEHFASTFVRTKLATFLAIDFPPTVQSRILTATLSEERHEGGMMLLAAHLKFLGYPIYYFGSDLPLEDLQKMRNDLNPDLVCLSYSDPERVERDLPMISQLPGAVCLGGIAFHDLYRVQQWKARTPAHVYFSSQKSGREAAKFVEMIVRSKKSVNLPNP